MCQILLTTIGSTVHVRERFLYVTLTTRQQYGEFQVSGNTIRATTACLQNVVSSVRSISLTNVIRSSLPQYWLSRVAGLTNRYSSHCIGLQCTVTLRPNSLAAHANLVPPIAGKLDLYTPAILKQIYPPSPKTHPYSRDCIGLVTS